MKKTRKPSVDKRPDQFLIEHDEKPKPDSSRIAVLKNGLIFDENKYEYKDDFVPADINNPLEIHTTQELVEHLKKHKNSSVEARILGANAAGDKAILKLDTKDFLEASKQKDSKKLRESIDSFAFDNSDSGVMSAGGGGLIGRDYTPLLGGPFAKQLYYRDYLRMISTCFFAYHHDPVARDTVSIITDFTIGRGFQLHAKGKDKDKAQIIWDAFVKVNDLNQQFDWAGTELSIYGEVMWWKLPKHQTRISFNPVVGEKVPHGIIPRVRLIDPSNIADIITIPEDIVKGVLAYVWIAPTQYQMYTTDNQPSTKFIYTQIPANQINHYKINSVSNEKRGRSDYFPALGFMKRLRDSVNYSLVAQQKAAAWCIDTTIKGNQEDVDQYVSSQNDLGAIPTAGSEFVHTEAIEREYLSNSATGKGSDSPTFSWCMNMIAMSAGIPLSYYGTHLSGAGTRANALVSTEPVAKKFERRRNVYDRMLRDMFDDLMKRFGYNAECEIIFPELITQDRSQVLRDLQVAQNNNWISLETAAQRAAKEFDLKDFDFRKEQELIGKDKSSLEVPPVSSNPLTTPSLSVQPKKSNSSMTAPEKTQVKNNLRDL